MTLHSEMLEMLEEARDAMPCECEDEYAFCTCIVARLSDLIHRVKASTGSLHSGPAISQQSIDTMRRALIESAKQHRLAGDRAHAAMCDAAARLECSGYNVIEALCDCGGSGYTPSANDSGDEPCPYHATQEERRTIHRADPLDTFD